MSREKGHWAYPGRQTIEGTVTRLAPFGAFVDLGEGIEGLLPSNQIAGRNDVTELAAYGLEG